MNIKDYREKELLYFIIGNVIAILLLGNVLNVEQLISDEKLIELLGQIINSALFMGMLYTLCLVLDALVPSKLKDFLIFFCWGKPGNRIFSSIRNNCSDDRFTAQEAKQKYAKVYTKLDKIKDVKEKKHYENSSWYRIYKLHEEETKIQVIQRDFLMCRDFAVIIIGLLIMYLGSAYTLEFISLRKTVIVYLTLMYVVSMLAANVKAKRFAYTVIASDVHIVDNKEKK